MVVFLSLVNIQYGSSTDTDHLFIFLNKRKDKKTKQKFLLIFIDSLIVPIMQIFVKVINLSNKN